MQQMEPCRAEKLADFLSISRPSQLSLVKSNLELSESFITPKHIWSLVCFAMLKKEHQFGSHLNRSLPIRDSFLAPLAEVRMSSRRDHRG